MKILIIIFLLITSTGNAANYYFSANQGNDTYPVLLAQNPLTPWKTLAKFNAFFPSLQPGDSVLFKRGETWYGSITISRSGTSSLPIVIGAYGAGAKPVITGFTTISGWTNLGGGIYENTCATCPSLLNMITINNFLQPMGRWPKATDANGGWKTINSHVGSSSITSSALAGQPSYVGGELVARKFQWIFDRGRIKTQASNTITQTPFVAPDHPTVNYEFKDNHGFFIQNHVNTLTVAGEWAYDSAGKKIKMFGNSGTVKAATIENLVTITSQNYIRFDNLSFTGSNTSTFYIDFSTNIQINNCDLSFAGINAIKVDGDLNTNHIQVYNCTISYTNNDALDLDESTHWRILNNTIRNTGMIRGMGLSGDGQYVAIHRVGAKSLMQFNVIKNTGYHGIHFLGDSVIVRNNYIDSFCMIKSDGGGIYAYGPTIYNGRRIVSNVVSNGIGDLYGINITPNPYSGQVHGIYMDSYVNGVQVDSNTSFNNVHSGLWLGSATNITARKNTLYNNSVAQLKVSGYEQPLSGITSKHNILFARTTGQQITAYLLNSNYLSTIGTIDSNMYCKPIWEPQGINGVSGYGTVPFSWDTYMDGGSIQTSLGSGDLFYSLDRWKIVSNQDAHTVKTSAPVSDLSKIRFEYNATSQPMIIPLTQAYHDITGTVYNAGILTLAPYSSIILLDQSASLSGTTPGMRGRETSLNGKSLDILVNGIVVSSLAGYLCLKLYTAYNHKNKKQKL